MPFDEVVMVDWSGSSRPKVGKDSIWVAHGRPVDGVRSANHGTRATAYEAIGRIVEAAVERCRRVLIGFDFSFGYSSGFAGYLRHLADAPGLEVTGNGDHRAPWEVVWDHLSGAIRDEPDNANNRFAVAGDINAATGTAFFWGCPRPGRALSPTKRELPSGLASNPLSGFRVAEQTARRQANKPIKSNWQLFGGVTVGSQVLLGLPYLQTLRRRYDGRVVVWPLETGFVADPLAAWPAACVVLAEIWPTAFTPAYGEGIRDDEQVRAVVQRCLAQQADFGLEEWFAPPSASQLPAEVRKEILAEEGWILGV